MGSCCSCVDTKQQEKDTKDQNLDLAKGGLDSKDAARSLDLPAGIEMKSKVNNAGMEIDEEAAKNQRDNQNSDTIKEKTRKRRHADGKTGDSGMDEQDEEFDENGNPINPDGKTYGRTKGRKGARNEHYDTMKNKKTDSGNKVPGLGEFSQEQQSSFYEDINLTKLRILFGKYNNVNNGRVLDEIIKSFYSKKELDNKSPAPRSVREAMSLVQGKPSPTRTAASRNPYDNYPSIFLFENIKK